MKNHKTGFAAIAAIIIVLVLLAGGAYFWSQKTTPAPAITPSAPPGFTPPTTPPPSASVPPATNLDSIKDPTIIKVGQEVGLFKVSQANVRINPLNQDYDGLIKFTGGPVEISGNYSYSYGDGLGICNFSFFPHFN